MLDQLVELAESGDTVQKPAAKVLVPFVQQAWLLAQRYDAVIANPPYMNTLFEELKDFIVKKFPRSKADMFAVFIERCIALSRRNGYVSMITMQSWMFLSSFVHLREIVVKKLLIRDMTQIGYNTFPSMNSKIAQGVAFGFQNTEVSAYSGSYFNLNKASQSADKQVVFKQEMSKPYLRDQKVFLTIPNLPLAYWLDYKFYDLFKNEDLLSSRFFSDGLTKTGNNDKYLKYWWEVSNDDVYTKYKRCVKGGEIRHYFGNDEYLVSWKSVDREHFKKDKVARITPEYLWNKSGITWTKITSSTPSFRVLEKEFVAETAGPAIFARDETDMLSALAMLNSCFAEYLLPVLNPTVSLQSNDVLRLPFPARIINSQISNCAKEIYTIFSCDWKYSETSKDYISSLNSGKHERDIKSWMDVTICESKNRTEKVLSLQSKVNQLITAALELENILNTEASYEKISLSRKLASDGNENEFVGNLIREKISFSIGCMMGRYSLDREGLVYAHAGNEGFSKRVDEGAYQIFPADDDGIIPMLDEPWFGDDATNRFRDFVKTVWGEDNLQENLDFVAQSLCLYGIKPKKTEGALEIIRRYLSTQFYKDHLRTYKKRPIYWLFSSGKQKAFGCGSSATTTEVNRIGVKGDFRQRKRDCFVVI